jgi:hypothetical protein
VGASRIPAIGPHHPQKSARHSPAHLSGEIGLRFQPLQSDRLSSLFHFRFRVAKNPAKANCGVVQRDLNILSDSFSIIGTKKLALSDDPDNFIRFSDTGGFLGAPVDRRLSFERFCDHAENLVAPNSLNGLENKFFAHVRFRGAEYVFCGSPSSEQILNLLLDWWEEPNVPKLWFPGKARNAEVESFRAHITSSQTGLESLWNAELLKFLFDEGFVPIRLHVNDQRVFVHVLNCPPAELPLSSLSLSLNKSSLECRNRLLVDNKTLSGFTIHFPTERMAATYLTKCGLGHILSQEKDTAVTVPKLVGLIGQVRIEGIIAGSQVDISLCDAQIDETSLTICDKATGNQVCAFNLAAPNLSINGTADEFIVSPDHSTIVRVTSDSKDFLLAVYQNRVTQDTATRTSHTGPFIATNDDGFVRIEVGETGATISVNGSEPSEIQTNIAEPKLSSTGTKHTVRVDNFELRGELPGLEGIYSTLKALTVKPSVAANFEQAVARILGLEGQYLTFCAFGKFAHAQIVITEALGIDRNASLAFVGMSQARENFLAIMGQFAGVLSRDCETTLHYFPAFVSGHDRGFFAAAGLQDQLDFGRAEAGYHAALRTYGSVAPHLYRIENALSRFGAFQKAVTKPEGWATFAPLGVSLAGSLLNPLLLIGAAHQTVSLVSREGSKSAHAADTLNEVFESCAQEWDFVMQTLIPFVSNRFAQDIYPVRLATSSILLKAYRDGDASLRNKLIELAARRLARLISFLEFPSASSPEISRLKCVDFLLESQKIARGIGERPF